MSVCVSLGEYPTIRFHRPPNPSHEASVLCSHLARFVQDGLDDYAQYHNDFPPPSPRPRGVLILTDRTMDLFAPLVHEFTYQAMVYELLPLKEGDKTFYRTVLNAGLHNQEEKEMELGEKDKIWVENRHLHMKDLLEKLVADFNKFRAENPQFADEYVEYYKLIWGTNRTQGTEHFEHHKRYGCRIATISGGQGALLTALEHGTGMHEHLSKMPFTRHCLCRTGIRLPLVSLHVGNASSQWQPV